MTNDLNILQDSLDVIRSCRPARGKEHIQDFIRATGLNEEDMMQWVRENWQMYAYRHMNTLITQSMASVMKKTKLKEALVELDPALVEEDEEKELLFSSRCLCISLISKVRFSNFIFWQS